MWTLSKLILKHNDFVVTTNYIFKKCSERNNWLITIKVYWLREFAIKFFFIIIIINVIIRDE